MPDLVTTAKGIAGGLPLAGVTGRAELMDSVHVGGLGGTYGGNPVACAAALGAIAEMREHDLAERALGDRHADARPAGEARRRAPRRRRHPRPRRDAGDRALRARHHEAGRRPRRRRVGVLPRPGVVTLTCGTWGNVFRFLPPLAISDALLDEAFDVVAEAFAATAWRSLPLAPDQPKGSKVGFCQTDTCDSLAGGERRTPPVGPAVAELQSGDAGRQVELGRPGVAEGHRGASIGAVLAQPDVMGEERLAATSYSSKATYPAPR